MSSQLLIPVLSPDSWKDYELVDSGYGEKLERFGPYTLIRPEPQAIWRPKLSDVEWKEQATARFDREQTERYRSAEEVKGGWKKKSGMKRWILPFRPAIIKSVISIRWTRHSVKS